MKSMSKVYIARVDDYIPDMLEEKLREGFDVIGGVRELVKGKKVFVKINQLSNRPPEEAVTTHPLVVEKVVKILVEYGAKIVIGDDIETQEGKDGFLITGMRDVAQKLGVELVNLRKYPYKKIEKEDNKFVKRPYIAGPVLEADVIVNLPKLKTHVQTLMTLAIKNFYGIIPIGERSRCHGSFPKIEDFSNVIADIFNARPPSLNIMDGILAMEGEGPQAGSPRKLGLLLISKDAVAMDSVVSHLLGLKPGEVKHIPIAASRGLGISNLREIDTIGLDPEKIKISDFKFPKIKWQAFISPLFAKFVYKMLRLRPRISNKDCVLCGKCIERCPVKAMGMKDKRVIIDYKLCIGCLCCQELCSSRAVFSSRSCIGEILIKTFRAIKRKK
ncbi:MAG: DUF362 domain-containing protein [Candidatus Omnitrophica bacterium]|nr:DUF362 domain-containing protein [Candidatus Omnitrophota bacterium]